jgi:hypothetical protein
MAEYALVAVSEATPHIDKVVMMSGPGRTARRSPPRCEATASG